MRIGIDARMYSQSGIGRYTRNLINQLQKLDIKNQYFIFLQKNEFDLVHFKANFQKVLADFSWYGATEQVRMPKILGNYNLDLMHFPHFNVPILYGGKFVVTIHDLIHQNFNMQRATTHSQTLYRFKQFGYKIVMKNAVMRSSKIFTPSHYVKDQLINNLGVKEEKIVITPESADHDIINLSKRLNQEKSLKIVQGFGIKGPYLFYIGNAYPHKNVEGLIDTYWKLQDKYKQLNLVLSGGDHYFWNRIKESVSAHSGNAKIFFTGFVTDEQLTAFYKNAVCLVLPSFEEGFGIPVLEAFACECPVVCSELASLPEVAGDAAVFFNPNSKDEMFKSIEKILNSERIRQELIKKGKTRYQEFSWEKMAEETLNVYTSV